MKILIINSNINLVGGVERYLLDLCTYLNKSDIEIDYLHSQKSNDDNKNINKQYTYPELWLKEYLFDEIMYKKLKSIIHDSKPDIVYIHNFDNGHAIEYITSIIPTIKFIHGYKTTCPDGKRLLFNPKNQCNYKLSFKCTLRAHFRYCMPRSPKKAFLCFKRAKKSLKATDRISQLIVASKYMKKTLIQNGIEKKKITIIPYFTLYGKEPYSQPLKKSVLYLGRIAEGKGLIELIQYIKKANFSIDMDIVGDGPLLNRAKELVKTLGSNVHINFHGWRKGTELKKIYKINSIVVVPSLWPEPFGIIGLESAMMNRPVVAFDSGGISDWLKNEKNGTLVDYGNYDKMLFEIGRLLSNEIYCKKIGEDASEFIFKQFSPQKHVNDLLKLINSEINKFKKYSTEKTTKNK